jgi:large subunit ribosomal protein L25
MAQVEIRCKARDLPEFIEVDMANVGMDDVVHLSNLKLPKGVQLTVDVTDGSHDAPVVSIHAPKLVVEEVEETEVAASEVPTTGETSEEGTEEKPE